MMLQTSRIERLCAYARMEAFFMSIIVDYIWVHWGLGTTHVCGLSRLCVLA